MATYRTAADDGRRPGQPTEYAVVEPFTGEVLRRMLTLHTAPVGTSLRLTVSSLYDAPPASNHGPRSG